MPFMSCMWLSQRGHRQYDACVLLAGWVSLRAWKYIPASTPTHTNTEICNTYCFSTATVVSRTRPNVMLYVHCLSSLALYLVTFPLEVWHLPVLKLKCLNNQQAISYLFVLAHFLVHAATSFLWALQCLLLLPGKQEYTVSKFWQAIAECNFKGTHCIQVLLNLSKSLHYIPNYDTTEWKKLWEIWRQWGWEWWWVRSQRRKLT